MRFSFSYSLPPRCCAPGSSWKSSLWVIVLSIDFMASRAGYSPSLSAAAREFTGPPGTSFLVTITPLQWHYHDHSADDTTSAPRSPQKWIKWGCTGAMCLSRHGGCWEVNRGGAFLGICDGRVPVAQGNKKFLSAMIMLPVVALCYRFHAAGMGVTHELDRELPAGHVAQGRLNAWRMAFILQMTAAGGRRL